MRLLRGTELKRLHREYRRKNPPQRQIAAVLQSVEYPYNGGAIFRLADGLGLSELGLCGITPTPPNPSIKKVGRSKDNNVNWRYDGEASSAVASLRRDGYSIVALELTDTAIPYDEFDYPARVCIVVGHEDHGVTASLLASCDVAVYIPMYGKGRSHNVAAAFGIVAYHIRQRD